MNGKKTRLADLDYAKPLQDEDELKQLIEFLYEESVTSYCEIGARYGGSFERIMRSLPLGSYGMAVDLPGGHFGDAKSKTILLAAAARLRRDGYAIDVVFGDSREDSVQFRVSACSPFDALMIDGDHSYQAVRNDFYAYNDRARIVILHDIAAPEDHKSKDGHEVEVPIFWQEIKDDFDNREIITRDSMMGIGILFMR